MKLPDPQRLPEDMAMVSRLRRRVYRWYRSHGRDLPWRESADPYHILVSEIMLQQTQVSRVVEKYHEWLRLFPSIRRLARASRREVLLVWSGLGYNRRALNLHETARVLRKEYDCKVPENISTLRGLPGIGKYTAHAIACFGHGRNVPVVDVNIRRVLGRISFTLTSEEDRIGEKTAWLIAESLLPARNAYTWNQALMDLGATICKATTPLCASCPAAAVCLSAGNMISVSRQRTGSDSIIPRRIYRGKVIELLRQRQPHHSAGMEIIALSLKPDFRATDKDWLVDILESLERDGMITISVPRRAIAAESLAENMDNAVIALPE